MLVLGVVGLLVGSGLVFLCFVGLVIDPFASSSFVSVGYMCRFLFLAILWICYLNLLRFCVYQEEEEILKLLVAVYSSLCASCY